MADIKWRERQRVQKPIRGNENPVATLLTAPTPNHHRDRNHHHQTQKTIRGDRDDRESSEHATATAPRRCDRRCVLTLFCQPQSPGRRHRPSDQPQPPENKAIKKTRRRRSSTESEIQEPEERGTPASSAFIFVSRSLRSNSRVMPSPSPSPSPSLLSLSLSPPLSL